MAKVLLVSVLALGLASAVRAQMGQFGAIEFMRPNPPRGPMGGPMGGPFGGPPGGPLGGSMNLPFGGPMNLNPLGPNPANMMNNRRQALLAFDQLFSQLDQRINLLEQVIRNNMPNSLYHNPTWDNQNNFDNIKPYHNDSFNDHTPIHTTTSRSYI